MGKSITFMTNYSALQGGKINIRVGNYILTKIMAGRFTMDLDAYEPKKGSPEETQKDEMYDDICKLARKDCYLSKWSKILDGNVDVVAFATDKAEIRTNNMEKYAAKVDFMKKYMVRFNFKGQLCKINLGYTKGNLLKLTIFSPFFQQFPSKGKYATREEMEVMLHTYDKENKDYGSASEAIKLGGEFMNEIKKQAGNLIEANESFIKKIKGGYITTDEKQMYACCPSSLEYLVREGLESGYIKYEIDKDREIISGDGKTVKYDGNIMIFYPTKTVMANNFGILVDNMKQVNEYVNSPLVYLGEINKELEWLKDAQVEDIQEYYKG